jgi:ribose transport system substrate-binding protein
MRHTHLRRSGAAIVAGAVAALALTACGSGSNDTSASGASGDAGGGKKYVIGISNPQGAQPILKGVQDALTAAAKHDGMEVKALDANLNPSKQVTDVDQLIAQHVDAIVVYPLDANSLTPALNRAKAAGIKLIGWAALLDPKATSVAPYDVNFDTGGAYRGTQLLSDYAAKQLPQKGNVLGVGIGVAVPALQMMLKNYQADSTKAGFTWLGEASNATDDVAGAEKAVSAALTKYKNDVQVVMAYNDSSAIGASAALKAAGVKDALVLGMNGDTSAVSALQNGTESATVDLVPWREGIILEALTKAALAGKKLPIWVENPSELYTKDTVGQRLDWNDAIKKIGDGSLSCAQGGGCPDAVTALQ